VRSRLSNPLSGVVSHCLRGCDKSLCGPSGLSGLSVRRKKVSKGDILTPQTKSRKCVARIDESVIDLTRQVSPSGKTAVRQKASARPHSEKETI